jgi:ketose-bisphosphate aldolase
VTLARGVELLRQARHDGRAVAAMTVYSLEWMRGICDAAEALSAPVILQAGSAGFASVGWQGLATASLAVAKAASVAVGVHLDHSRDLEEVRQCVSLGYSSVMFDAADLEFAENVARTKAVVLVAHANDVWVEGELGFVAGDESVSNEVTAASLTTPDKAEEYVARTGIDALAVSIGNVHGMASTAVRLDFERLRAVRAVVDVPLVLHGTSGLDDRDLAEAVRLGIAKVNINTELRRAYLEAVRAAVVTAGDDVRRLQAEAVAAIAVAASRRLKVLESGYRRGDVV